VINPLEGSDEPIIATEVSPKGRCFGCWYDKRREYHPCYAKHCEKENRKDGYDVIFILNDRKGTK